MQSIVQAQAPHSPRFRKSKRGKEQANISDLISNTICAEDVALDYAGLASLGDISCAGWQDGIAIVRLAIAGDETDEAL